jgi:photosystem II stability/assembly factor-like uncharacterized protein
MAFGNVFSVFFATTVLVFADAPSPVYVGTELGLYLSVDGGATWQHNDELGTVQVIAVGADQGESGLLLVSTPDGLFRSTDAGATWVKGEVPVEITAHRILVDPKPGGLSYFMHRSLWASNDRGISWREVVGHPPMYDVTLDPSTTPTTVYIAGRAGIFKSTDEAFTWTPIVTTNASFLRLSERAESIYFFSNDGLSRASETEHGRIVESLGPGPRALQPPDGAVAGPWYTSIDALAVGPGRNALVTGCFSQDYFDRRGNDIWPEAQFVIDVEWLGCLPASSRFELHCCSNRSAQRQFPLRRRQELLCSFR